nr:hypothetical protein [Amycolatopsis benzoatilytica]
MKTQYGGTRSAAATGRTSNRANPRPASSRYSTNPIAQHTDPTIARRAAGPNDASVAADTAMDWVPTTQMNQVPLTWSRLGRRRGSAISPSGTP